jgi:hypothetical protein
MNIQYKKFIKDLKDHIMYRSQFDRCRQLVSLSDKDIERFINWEVKHGRIFKEKLDDNRITAESRDYLRKAFNMIYVENYNDDVIEVKLDEDLSDIKWKVLNAFFVELKLYYRKHYDINTGMISGFDVKLYELNCLIERLEYIVELSDDIILNNALTGNRDDEEVEEFLKIIDKANKKIEKQCVKIEGVIDVFRQFDKI